MRRAAIALLLTVGCSSTPSVSIDLTQGLETDTFDANPMVTRVDVHVVAADDSFDDTESAAPGGSVDFGSVDANQVFSVDATGYAGDGTVIVRGQTVSGIQLSAVSGSLPLFVERLGGFSRPSGAIPVTHVGGVAATIGDQYVFLTGGTSAIDANGASASTKDGEYYDMVSLAGEAAPKGMPRTAKTLVARGDQVLAIDDDGATFVDFDTGVTQDQAAPSGVSFAEVAGGIPLDSSAGDTYVVGASRLDGKPTKSVLLVDADGNLSGLATTTARAGAATLWSDSDGLIVAGGSATGAGVEVYAASKFNEKAYPSDATVGAAASLTDKGALLLAGGILDGKPAPMRTLSLACKSSCTAKSLGMDLGAKIDGSRMYSIGQDRFVLAGEDADAKATRAFLIDVGAGSVTEMPLREPRRGAALTPTPAGTLAILGGVHTDGTPALTLEQFFPE